MWHVLGVPYVYKPEGKKKGKKKEKNLAQYSYYYEYTYTYYTSAYSYVGIYLQYDGDAMDLYLLIISLYWKPTGY